MAPMKAMKKAGKIEQKAMKKPSKAMTKGAIAASPATEFEIKQNMKAMKKPGKAMTKGAIAQSLATEFEIKQNVAGKIISSFADLAAKEVKSAGIFTFPGLCRIKTRVKPATKAGKREVFGKIVVCQAKPARTIVKAYPVSALKKSV